MSGDVKPRTRLAVDIGGTFTDVVLEVGTHQETAKVLTTPVAPAEGVVRGIEAVLGQAGIAAADVDLVLHGTTLATNAILERRGAATALVTTEGFRDVLDIGYESRFDQYDVMLEKPLALVPRERRYTVAERIDASGQVLVELDEAAMSALARTLVDDGIESVGIGFLHAYANGAHEARAREILSDVAPGLSITLSSEVCPELREYERFSTTVANAYVRPLMAGYLSRLEVLLEGMGIACPILLMTSGGGLTSVETAMRYPIRLVESGPAGGAILAGSLSVELGLGQTLSFDMGGTTAKICLLENGSPKTARELEVDRTARFQKGSGLPLRIPVIEMVEIGAGGGSIAYVDELRRVAVGPRSAGAEPGPAAYGRGGDQPTVTDADIVLGRIDPSRFAGGKVTLDPGAAADALARAVGEKLDLDATVAAFAVVEMIEETMSNAARVHAVEQGKSASEHTLIAFGGAAPLHAVRLAEKLGITTIVIPDHAGVGSAVGMLRAPVSYEVVRSRNMRLGQLDVEGANEIIEEMRAEARAVVEPAAAGSALVETRGAYMRYVGQGHEIHVEVPMRPLVPGDAQVLQTAFDVEYARLFRRAIPEAELEVLTWTVSLAASSESGVHVADSMPSGTDSVAAPFGHRSVVDPATAERTDVAAYWRDDLPTGAMVRGPAIIAELETTTYVTAGFDAQMNAGRHLVLRRNGEHPQ